MTHALKLTTGAARDTVIEVDGVKVQNVTRVEFVHDVDMRRGLLTLTVIDPTAIVYPGVLSTRVDAHDVTDGEIVGEVDVCLALAQQGVAAVHGTVVEAFMVRDDEIGDVLGAILTDAKRYRALRDAFANGDVLVFTEAPDDLHGAVGPNDDDPRELDALADTQREQRRARLADAARATAVDGGTPVPQGLVVDALNDDGFGGG